MEVNTEEPFGETTDERLLSYLVEELEDFCMEKKMNLPTPERRR